LPHPGPLQRRGSKKGKLLFKSLSPGEGFRVRHIPFLASPQPSPKEREQLHKFFKSLSPRRGI